MGSVSSPSASNSALTAIRTWRRCSTRRPRTVTCAVRDLRSRDGRHQVGTRLGQLFAVRLDLEFGRDVGGSGDGR